MFVVLIYMLLFRICCGFNVIFRFKVYNCDYYSVKAGGVMCSFCFSVCDSVSRNITHDSVN